MSNSADVTYRCPYCGKEFEITVYPSVNAKEDPDLRDRCLSGDIFRHSCPHCKTDFMVQNDLVYSDPDHRFILWVSSRDPGTRLTAMAAPLVKAGYKLRRCSTVAEMIEKIQIFEDGADDVCVELAKYDSFIEFMENKKGNPEDVTAVEYQRTENDVMKINIRTDDKGMAFLIPVAMIEEAIEENKERYEVDDTQFPLINMDWIISLFTESAGEA